MLRYKKPMKNSRKKKSVENLTDKLQPADKMPPSIFKILVIVWSVVFGLAIAGFFIGQFVFGDTTDSTAAFPLVATITSFAAFIVQSIFSFAVVRHHEVTRIEHNELRKNTLDINARSEAFRTMQFIASHYTMIDFVDYMLMYEEYDNYVEKLRSTGDFGFYLAEDDVCIKGIRDNFDDYKFVTVKMPLVVIEGKSIGKLRFSSFKLATKEKEHRFVSCDGSNEALVLFNEIDHRNEVVLNLIMKKSSDFYWSGKITPFQSIKVDLTVQSLLGVAVSGAIDLYFTNPQKLEKSGANKYNIISSHFEVAGLPTLTHSVHADVKEQLSSNR